MSYTRRAIRPATGYADRRPNRLLSLRRASAAAAEATVVKTWWAEQDSNLRRLSRQIYSLVHLAALVSARLRRARDPLRGNSAASFAVLEGTCDLELAMGIEPTTSRLQIRCSAS